MKMLIYSVRDCNVGFNQPFCESNDDVAILLLLGFAVLLRGGNPTLFSAGGVILLRSLGKRPLHLPEKLLK